LSSRRLRSDDVLIVPGSAADSAGPHLYLRLRSDACRRGGRLSDCDWVGGAAGAVPAAERQPVFAECRSSIISRLTFSWLDRSVLNAYRKEIGEADVNRLDPSLRVRTVHGEFVRYFPPLVALSRSVRDAAEQQENLSFTHHRVNADTEQLVDSGVSEGDQLHSNDSRDGAGGRHRRKLLPALWKAFGGQLMLSWAVVMIHGLLEFANPLLLEQLIKFSGSSEELWHGFFYTFLFFSVALLSSLAFHNSCQISLMSGIKIRSALIAAIYRKSLSLTLEARSRSTVGEIVNLLTVDSNKIADAVPFLWVVLVSPVQIFLALVMLWMQLGIAVLAGIAVFLVIIPLNAVVMVKSQSLEEREMKTKDERMRLLNEVINAMKVIKLYAWEPSFWQKIDQVRKKEVGLLAKNAYLLVLVVVSWTVAPFLVMVVTFITYIYSGNDHVLTASKAFVSLTLFNILHFPIAVLPWTITESVNKIMGQRLKFINLTVPRGSLVAVVGKVGCGKSSLLQSVLGETVRLCGSVAMTGSAAYVPQEAWIQNLTVRDNILFGRDFDQARYDEALRACQLEKDLQLLTAGDATEIGERGINLSGGQKQRVSLARAVYQDSDIYLLDDPLAAVDSHVGKKLFHEVIGKSGLLRDKTRILVTHGIHWLPHVDEIVVIDNGRISEQGSYEHLLDHDGPFASFLKEFFLHDGERKRASRSPAGSISLSNKPSSDFPAEDIDEEDEEVRAEKERILRRLASHSGHQACEFNPSVQAETHIPQLSSSPVAHGLPSSIGSYCSDASERVDAKRPPALRQTSRVLDAHEVPKLHESRHERTVTEDDGKLIDEETMETGRVSLKSYVYYASARGLHYVIIMSLLHAGFSAVEVASSIWLSTWTSDPMFNNSTIYGNLNNSVLLRELNDYYIEIYGTLGVAVVLLVAIFAMIEAVSSLRASRLIHNSLLSSLFRAPMSFFDTTPTGRIVNRFSKDMEVVDHELPMVINDFYECLMASLSCIVVISYTTPIFLAAVLPLGIIYAIVQVFYLPISRQSRRLDSRSRSPILTNFSESVAGAAIIRAFRQQQRFIHISDDRVDCNARFYFLKVASNRWLGFRLELLGTVAVTIASLLAVLARGSLTPGLVGLSVSYALDISNSLNWMVRQLTELETDSVAVERLNEYSNLETEAPWTTDSLPPSGWPSRGRVEFCNYATRYRQGLDLVLQGISVSFEPGHKVGIVGRTGAGKSSLTLGLFRLIESTFGHIEVDGVRIDRLGLHSLRSALTILPQEPTVFSGSLRSNLDPFDERTDEELWAALDAAHLSSWARGLSAGLAHECGEGGTNLSVGQRQLVCLARALMRRSRLLVLDEATAAVDLETDSLIMATVRQQFADSTVIIIAHRLATIMDSDRVMVLDSGRVREFAPPRDLLAKQDSYFHFLAKEAGLLPGTSAIRVSKTDKDFFFAKSAESNAGQLHREEAVSWNSARPVFSDCFCKSALALPSAALLLLFIPYLVYLRSFPSYSAASQEASGEEPDAISYVSPSVLVVALIVCLVVQSVEQKRLIGASAMMFFFYMMSLVVSVPVLYTRIIMSSDAGSVLDVYGLTTFSSYLALLLTQLVLTCIYDSGLTPADEADDSPTATGSVGAAGAVPAAERQPVFAECRSSIISRLTFSWLDRSVLNAYRKEIGEADVNRLDPSLRVRTVHGEFVRYFPPLVALSRSERDAAEQQENLSFTHHRVNADTEQLVDSGDSEGDQLHSNDSRDGAGGRHRRKLLPALWKAFGSQLILSWSIMMIHGLLAFANPFLLESLINFSTNGEELWHGILYTFLFFVVAVLSSITFHASFQLSLTCGIKFRSALIASIYRKSLTLTQESRARSTVGEIVNLMTVDSNKIADSIPFFWAMLVSPVQIVIALVMLWAQLGTAVLAGIGIFVVIIPVNGYIMAKAQKLEEKEMKTKDERLKLLNEVLNAMKVIKLYAWEPSFQQKISHVRRTEVGFLGQMSYLFSVVIIMWTVAPFLVMVLTFITYIYSGDDHILTASKAFVSLTLFNILRFPITVLPWTITESVNAYVSIKRIQNFLFEDDIDESSVLKLPSSPDGNSVEIEGASFGWKRTDSEPLLKDVNIQVPKGKLIAIVGKVGCGKSSLLQSVLGETNLTVRDNILFGRDFDQARYDEALRACQLEKDLQLLTAGDATEIGERGINLSGGQKQRVSLARAVYQDSDIYLLDDPLAAVDSHVGKKLFHEVIGKSGLLRDKTRILVTHGIHWLPHVDEIVVIDNGRISEQGSYEHLLDHDGPFASFLKEFFLHDGERKRASRSRDVSVSIAEIAAAAPEEEEEDEELAAEKARILQRLASCTSSAHEVCAESPAVVATSPSQSPPPHHVRQMSSSVNSHCSDTADRLDSKRPSIVRQTSKISQLTSEKLPSRDEDVDGTRKAAEQSGRLIDEETMESGSVSLKSYVFYIAARGYHLVLMTIMAHLAYTVVNVASSVWLSTWTSDPLFSNASVTGNLNNSAYLRDINDYYLSIYGIFGVGIVVLVGIYAVMGVYSALRASRSIHKSLLTRLFRVPMSFFDTTPTGRIVNRFSKDMEVVDRELPMIINDFLECFMATVSCIVVISYTTPIFLAAVVPLGIIYAGIQVFYLPISRQSRRLDSRSRSPILTNFSESIAGAAVIRAFRQQQRFVGISDYRVDNNSRFYFLKLASNRWLGFRLELLGTAAVVIAALLAVLGRDSLTPGLVGLSVSYALQISDALNWMVRQLTELETNSVAVERLDEYSNLETEAPWTTDSLPPSGWPSRGRVEFCNYATRYRPGLDLVLQGISVSFEPGHKVGIVGRTGAGKSSLTLGLFRLIESAFGHIEVDGVRIDRLGLHSLRSALTILPQEPTVFSGSLRSNLDPFDERTDEELWAALDAAHLSSWARGLSAGLAHECGEGGTNLSVGQRQLVCLARALMRRSRLLVLDEATAAVDLETDSLIMATVRQQFADSTVIIIAHRLATIMDSDRVMVLDSGRVREFAPPRDLLAKQDSYFHFLAKEAGLLPGTSAK
uniref:ABC-type glutathione-S-conjugate transporter n=1 Tax=Macrostomum lignano TaxID=282301 RepID=A0A1I8JE23_9PLAT